MFVLHKGDGGRPFFIEPCQNHGLRRNTQGREPWQNHGIRRNTQGRFAAAVRLRGGKPETLFRWKRKSKNNQWHINQDSDIAG
jgi:hypothetical protein